MSLLRRGSLKGEINFALLLSLRKVSNSAERTCAKNVLLFKAT